MIISKINKKGVKATIGPVVKSGLCTGCGSCVAICPQDAIKMTINQTKGIYLPHVDEEKCNRCGVCFETCPGHSVDFHYLNREVFGKLPGNMILGNYLNCYTGHAADANIRYNSASGGLITALLVFALEQRIIDGALVTGMSESQPLEPRPFIARNRGEIISAAKSKYCPVPANIALKEILEEDGKFVVVGLPCHIQGIRKAELVDERLKERIVLILGLFCSHPMSFSGTEFLLDRYSVPRQDIASIDYRGEGWPGHMAVHLRNGTRRLIPYNDYNMFFWGLNFFTPARCYLCCDQSAELADISFGDAWLPELAGDKIGTSVIVSRSVRSENLLKQAILKGDISTNSLDSGCVSTMVTKKTAYKARSQLARLAGKKLPRYTMEPGKAGLAAYPAAAEFYLAILLSRKHLWWLIRLLARLARVAGKFLRLTGLKR